MPFTLCHPALVLPLRQCAPRATALSALVIGSMTPDVAYFVPVGVSGAFSHSAIGLLLYCLPAGALLYLVYHALVRDAFVAWAPPPIAARMRTVAWRPRDARAACVILASLLAGAVSHVVWDGFTHGHGYAVRYIAALRVVLPVGADGLPMFKLLQHLSSLVGFIVIAFYCVRWFERTEPVAPAPPRLSARQRLAALAAVGVAGLAGGLAGLLLRPASGIEHALFNVTVTGIGTAGLATLLLCFGWRRALARR